MSPTVFRERGYRFFFFSREDLAWRRTEACPRIIKRWRSKILAWSRNRIGEKLSLYSKANSRYWVTHREALRWAYQRMANTLRPLRWQTYQPTACGFWHITKNFICLMKIFHGFKSNRLGRLLMSKSNPRGISIGQILTLIYRKKLSSTRSASHWKPSHVPNYITQDSQRGTSENERIEQTKHPDVVSTSPDYLLWQRKGKRELLNDFNPSVKNEKIIRNDEMNFYARGKSMKTSNTMKLKLP